jgi:hypothetical protein
MADLVAMAKSAVCPENSGKSKAHSPNAERPKRCRLEEKAKKIGLSHRAEKIVSKKCRKFVTRSPALR